MSDRVNREIFDWSGLHGLPRFQDIAVADFAPAFDAALKAHDAEIDAIAGHADAPSFENTIEALEVAGDQLSRVSALFWNRAGAHTDPEIQALEREIAPRMSRHYSRIGMNAALFARIDALWENRASLGLNTEQMRVLERHWKGFVKSGAKLEKAEQERLADINETLAGLGARFGQNVLADEKNWSLMLEEGEDLKGLPDFLLGAMRGAARERGAEGKYAVTLSRSIIEPCLLYTSPSPRDRG